MLPCVLPAQHLLAAALTLACLAPSPAEAAITIDPDGLGNTDVVPAINTPGDQDLSITQVLLGETAVGDLLIDGGSTLTTVNTTVFNGTLTIGSGGTLLDTVSRIDTPGTVTVTGVGASLLTGDLGNQGVLNVTDGAFVSGRQARIGLEPGTTGVVTVSGAGSVSSGRVLTIGSDISNGIVNVQDGGLVEYNTFDLHPDNGTLNWTNGTIRVTGTPAAGNLIGFNSPLVGLAIGRNSGDRSILELTEGATHSSPLGVIGSAIGATGTVTVRDAGSSWNSGTALFVGSSGTGFLNVQEGAIVTNESGFVGSDTFGGAGAGTGTVTGSGSTWNNTGSLTIGSNANGVVQVEDGGRVIAGGAGGITVNALGSLDVVGGGILDSASIVIDGGRFSRDATGEVDFASDGTVMTVRNNGRASIAGNFTLAANRTINLESGGDWNNNGDFTAEGTFNVDSGTTLNGSPNAAPTAAAGSAGNTLNTSGALNVDGAVLFNGGAGGPGSVTSPPIVLFGPGGDGAAGGVLNATGGPVDLNGSAAMRFDGGAGGSTGGTAFGGNGGDGGTINISGAAVTLNDSSTLSASGGIGGAGVLVGTGGAGGALNLNSGSLIQNGSSSVHLLGRDVLLDVSAGGTLNLLGGDYTINDNATLDLRAGQGIGSPTGETISITGGTFQMNGGTVFASTIEHPGAGSFNLDGGALHVEDFNGTLEQNGGTLVPGDSPGTTTVTGDYNLTAGTVAIELAGLSRGTQHDAVLVGGALNLGAGSSLDVTLLNNFSPSLGDSFDVLDFASVNGTFGAVNLPGLTNGMTWDQSQVHTEGLLLVLSGLAGDYNNDGLVDAADYTVWRDNQNGPAGTLPNDATGVAIGQPQYDAWRANFGAAFPTAPAVIPEPAAVALLLFGLGARVLSR